MTPKEIQMQKELKEKEMQLKTKRAEKCWLEVQAVLKKHNCTLEPKMALGLNGVSGGIDIIAA